MAASRGSSGGGYTMYDKVLSAFEWALPINAYPINPTPISGACISARLGPRNPDGRIGSTLEAGQQLSPESRSFRRKHETVIDPWQARDQLGVPACEKRPHGLLDERVG